MSEPILSEQARADLDEAWDDLSERSIKAADRLVDRFLASARMHARFPESGRSREEIAQGLRSFVVAPYVAFYRARADTIEVIRVLHGRRDIAHSMGEE